MKRPIIPTLLLALILTACGGASSGSSTSYESMPAATSAPAAEAVAPAAGAPALTDGATEAYPLKQEQQQLDPQRLVIKNANLSLTVEQVTQAEAAVRELTGRMGGYIVKVENNGTDADLRTHMTIRVPANRFDEALTGVQGLAKKVEQRTISGDDVTEEFVDLDSRLRNLEATRDRLLTFLDKATKVEDALNVNQSLSDVQGQIEQIRGRMQYLKQSAALSTIDVFLNPVPVTPIVPEGTWQPMEVARGALQTLIVIGQGLVSVLIVLVVWTPLWLPFVLAVFWATRRLRRSRVVAPTSAAQN